MPIEIDYDAALAALHKRLDEIPVEQRFIIRKFFDALNVAYESEEGKEQTEVLKRNHLWYIEKMTYYAETQNDDDFEKLFSYLRKTRVKYSGPSDKTSAQYWVHAYVAAEMYNALYRHLFGRRIALSDNELDTNLRYLFLRIEEESLRDQIIRYDKVAHQKKTGTELHRLVRNFIEKVYMENLEDCVAKALNLVFDEVACALVQYYIFKDYSTKNLVAAIKRRMEEKGLAEVVIEGIEGL